MATQHFKRNLLLNLYREEKKYLFFFLLPLKRDKHVWHLQPLSSIWRPLAFLPVTLSSLSNEHPGLISFRIDWLDLLAVQGTLKSLLQHHSLKASILRCSAFFIVQLSHPYMTTGKIIALTRWTFVDKVMSLLFNMMSRLVITFLLRSKCLLISWLQSPSAVIWGPPQKIASHCCHCFLIY